MKITQIRTIHFTNFPNITFLELCTDTGIVGLGETYYTPRSVTTYIEEVLAPQLLNADPLQIEHFWRRAYDGSHVYGNKGLEMRCLSAVDIALWDILGQHAVSRSGKCSAGIAIQTASWSTTPALPLAMRRERPV